MTNFIFFFFFFLKLNVFVSTQFKWLNFLGQNDSIFSLSAPREKNAIHYAYDQTFYLKYEWITEKIPLSAAFMSRYTKRQ